VLLNRRPLNAVPLNAADNAYAWFKDRVATDVIVLDDSGRQFNWVGTVIDPATLLDEVIKSVIPGAGGTTYTRSFDDVFALADELLAYRLRGRLLEDAVATADAVIRTEIIQPTLTDAINLTDERISAVLRFRQSDDFIVLTDEQIAVITGGAVLTRSVTDVLDVTDTGRLALWVALLSDLLQPSDSATGTLVGGGQTFTQTLSEALTLVDEVIQSRLRGRVSDDPFSITDSATGTLISSNVQSRSLTDLITLSDTGRLALWIVTVADRFDLSDEAIKVLIGTGVYARTVTESVEVHDGGREVVATLLVDDDGIVVSDELSKIVSGTNVYSRTQDDFITFSDAFTRGLELYRLQTDAITVTDDLQRRLELYRLLEDSLNVTDAFTKLLVSSNINFRTQEDSIELTDEVVRVRWLTRLIEDTVEVVDALIKSIVSPGAINVATLTDLVTMSDEQFDSVERYRTVSDTFALTDQALRSIELLRTLTDGFDVTDGTLSFRLNTRMLEDVLEVLDFFDRVFVPFKTFGSLCIVGIEQPVKLGRDVPIILGRQIPIILGRANV
jgi:hypothetical protein